MTDPTLRFGSRADAYSKYRPGYPPAVIDVLREAGLLGLQSMIADIGSGTGLLARLFLEAGNPVFAVEPNREMRTAAELLLQGFSGFRSIAARAEATTLPDGSVDLVTAGQAFHWFDRQKARAEFRRILRPAGGVMLIWNDRDNQASPFMRAYERIMERYGTDYAWVSHRQVEETALAEFFAPRGFKTRVMENHQAFDFDGLRGRLLSSSYAPEAGHPRFEPMLAELMEAFRRHQVDGQVRFQHQTRMYYGVLGGGR